MGFSNLRHGLENKHAALRGEIKAIDREMKEAQACADRLPELYWHRRRLADLVQATELLLRHDNPDWQPDKLKPRRPRKWTGPFKTGDQGRIALNVLRENGGWLRPYEIAVIMLDQIEHDPEDRRMRQRLTNSLGNYLKNYEGDLVESRGDYAKEWRVIRENELSTKR